ncbi:LAFA_0E09956g1_1 [Lachancea sp. 'fantastica']|nr:LAFA_0E09956g1_1 [Lachancea sp. 'fantastica']
MGRRKIAIEPILDERNRTVTFIKRKAGLFKKAHELAVLCQVDIAVIILGSNNTFYEFSSVDTDDLIEHYQNPKLQHDAKDPSNYGNYRKKERVVIRDRSKRRFDRVSPPSTNGLANDDVIVNGAANSGLTTNKIRSGRSQKGTTDHLVAADDGDDDDDDEDDDENDDEEENNVDKRGGDNNDNDNDNDDDDELNNSNGEENDLGNNSVSQTTAADQRTARTNSRKRRKKAVAAPSFSKVAAPNSTQNPPFNSLQQQVQRQFHNLYAVASNPEAAPSTNFAHFGTQPNSSFSRSSMPNTYTGMPQTMGPVFNPANRTTVSERNYASANAKNGGLLSTPVMMDVTGESAQTAPGSAAQAGAPAGNAQTLQTEAMPSRSQTRSTPQSIPSNSGVSSRPTLRVQIPSSSGTAIKSEPSSAVSPSRSSANGTSQFSRGNAGHIELPRPTQSRTGTPQSAHIQTLSPGLERSDKIHSFMPSSGAIGASGSGNPANGFLFNGLPSALNASPSIQQYFATPVQASATGTGPNASGPTVPSVSHPHGYLMQKHMQMAQHEQQQRVQNAPTSEAGLGSSAGSLPSKFANDLMVASPGTSMSMFQDWGYARAGNGNQNSANQTSEPNPTATSNVANNNGSSGLTPYMNVTNHTPLLTKYFTFGDPSDDKNKRS